MRHQPAAYNWKGILWHVGTGLLACLLTLLILSSHKPRYIRYAPWYWGANRLISAIYHGDMIAARKILRWNPWLVNARDYLGDTPLLWAIDMQNASLVEFLLLNGADVHRRDADGYSPLQIAAAYNAPDVVRVLLAHGASSSIDAGVGPKRLEACYQFRLRRWCNHGQPAEMTIDPAIVLLIKQVDSSSVNLPGQATRK